MLIAQITDTHIVEPSALAYSVVDTAAFLECAVAALNALAPPVDLTVVTGDLVDHGTEREYAHLRALLAPLRMPVIVIPGNHDSRPEMRAAFGADGYLSRDGFLQFASDDWPLRIVALDTLVPGSGGGALCAERLAWLDQTLAAAPDRPTLVLMHHPPFATGIDFMDKAGLLEGTAALAEIVRRNPQVQRIACGHLHRTIDCRFAGTVAGTAPSTAHQIILNLVPGARLGLAFEPPGYQLHRWDGDCLVTHTAAIGDWPRVQRPARDKP